MQDLFLDKLIIETDAPYLSPHPFRGKRNEPQEIITSQIYKNTLDLFNLTLYYV